MTTPSLAELEQHVRDLCTNNRIIWWWVDGEEDRGEAWRSTRTAALPRILSVIHYLTTLHEIGHICGGSSRRRLECEAHAWNWALEHSLIRLWDIPYEDLNACAEKLISYLHTARKKGLWYPTTWQRNVYWDTLHVLLSHGDIRRRRLLDPSI